MRIILLRGLGRDQLHWKPLLKELKNVLPSTAIETPDLPGAGILFAEKSPFQICNYIPALEKQISTVSQATILVGLSLGGMIALEWAKQYPNKFQKIILINSSSRLNYFFQRLNLFKVAQHPLAILGPTILQTESSIYCLTCNSELKEQIIEEWVNIQLSHPVSRRNQLRQVLAAAQFKVPKANEVPPINVIYSEKDRLVSPACSIRLARHFDASIHSHPWAGHDLPQDDPVWLAKTLKELVTRHTPEKCD